MKNRHFITAFLFGGLLLLVSPLYAQLKETDRYLSIGVQIGTAHYFGDLSPESSYFSTEFSLTEPTIGVQLQKRMSARFSTEVSLQWARLLGDDVLAEVGGFNYRRNLHFRNDITELAIKAQWDIVPSRGHYSKRSLVTPYVFGGVGVFHHRPRAKTDVANGGVWVPLSSLRTEGQSEAYGDFAISFPLGIGTRFKINDKMNASVEVGFRFTNTDYLDDVSGTYPSAEAFADNSLAFRMSNRSQETEAARTGELREVPTSAMPVGSPRGDDRSADRFLFTGIKLQYILAKNPKKTQLSRLHRINTPIETLAMLPPKPDSTYLRFQDRYKVENLAINSEYSEMSPRFYQGGLVYVSDRRDNKNFEKKGRSGYFNFFYSPIHDLFKNELTKPIFLKDKPFLKHHHFAADYLENRQQIILSLYEQNDNSAEVKKRKLYIADVAGENVWENIRPLPFANENSSITQCSVSDDGKTLYFASDRPGGFGGTDLYVSYLYKGQWTYPINLGEKINTEGNEMFPFIHAEGHLYFASDGHPGMGGLDVFEAMLNKESSVIHIKNVGAPINSTEDDFGLILDKVKRHGYFTSNRDGGKGGNDIYKLEVLKLAPSRELTDERKDLFQVEEMTLKGMIVNKNTNEPIPRAIVKLFDKLEDDLMLTRSDNFGRFEFKIHSDGLYEIGSTVRGFQRMKNEEFSTVGIIGDSTFNYTIAMEPISYKFRVKGKVTDKETGEPIVGAEVVLLNLYDDQNESIITDLDGSYSFELKKDHNYVLFMLELGYEHWEIELSTFNKRSSETKIVNIELNPKEYDEYD